MVMSKKAFKKFLREAERKALSLASFLDPITMVAEIIHGFGLKKKQIKLVYEKIVGHNCTTKTYQQIRSFS